MKRAKDTYSGRRLLENYTMDSVSVWDIYGEDPNCDMGGTHHTPFLERVSGRLEDVFAYAEKLPGFWQWGGGGEIRPHKSVGVKEIPLGYGDAAEQEERKEKALILQQQIAELQADLNDL